MAARNENVVAFHPTRHGSAQRTYLVALSRGADHTEASASAGVTPSQAWTWRKDAEFQKQLHRAVSVLLNNASPDAAQVLWELATSEDVHPKIRLDAAKTILDRTGHAAKVEVKNVNELTTNETPEDMERRYKDLTVSELEAIAKNLQDNVDAAAELARREQEANPTHDELADLM